MKAIIKKYILKIRREAVFSKGLQFLVLKSHTSINANKILIEIKVDGVACPFTHKINEHDHDDYGQYDLSDTSAGQAVFSIIFQMKIANHKRKQHDAAHNSYIKMKPK